MAKKADEKNTPLSLIYAYVAVAFVALLLSDFFLAKVVGGAALLLACFEIGRTQSRNHK